MRQIINVGNADNDPIADTIRAGGQKINQNFSELYSKFDEILVNNGFSISGQNFIVNSGTVYSIAGVQYTIASATSLPITLASTGKQRQVIAMLKIGGICALKYGEETTDFPPKPAKDANTIEWTDFPVTDSLVGNASPPVIGERYIKKESLSDTVMAFGGSDLILPNMGRFNYILRCDSVGNFKGVSGNFLGIDNELVVGTEVKITCDTDFLPTLDHGDSIDGNLPFNFPGGQNLKLQRNTVAVFRFNGLDLMFESYSNIGPETLALAKTYADTKSTEALTASRTTPQFNITGNTTLTNAHNGAILKIKATCTITVPTGLVESFSCVARTFTGATCTWVEGSGFTLDSPEGKTQDPFRSTMFFKDGNTNSGILEGGLRS